MRRRRCRSCRGEYAVDDGHGHAYYHQCPALSEPEWEALPPPLKARFKPGDRRPNERNENVEVDDRGKFRGIKHEGDGVDEI